EEVSEWSYTDGQHRGATTGPGKKGEGGKKGKISVAYFDPEDGRTKTQSLEHDGPSQSHPFTQPTKTAANHSAQSRKTQVSRNERRMTLSGPC
ncbi:late control protein D, partial [Salmonella enterica]|nr:late control protein D [Salmonella enterica]